MPRPLKDPAHVGRIPDPALKPATKKKATAEK